MPVIFGKLDRVVEDQRKTPFMKAPAPLPGSRSRASELVERSSNKRETM
jgi:hypothetical protein